MAQLSGLQSTVRYEAVQLVSSLFHLRNEETAPIQPPQMSPESQGWAKLK